MYTEREMTNPSPFAFIHTKVAPSLSTILLSLFFVSFVHCCCDIMSQLFSLNRGIALDPKNPDLYYSLYKNFKKLWGGGEGGGKIWANFFNFLRWIAYDQLYWLNYWHNLDNKWYERFYV